MSNWQFPVSRSRPGGLELTNPVAEEVAATLVHAGVSPALAGRIGVMFAGAARSSRKPESSGLNGGAIDHHGRDRGSGKFGEEKGDEASPDSIPGPDAFGIPFSRALTWAGLALIAVLGVVLAFG